MTCKAAGLIRLATLATGLTMALAACGAPQGEPGLPGLPGNPGEPSRQGSAQVEAVKEVAVSGTPTPVPQPMAPGLPGVGDKSLLQRILDPLSPGSPGEPGKPGLPGNPGNPGAPGPQGAPAPAPQTAAQAAPPPSQPSSAGQPPATTFEDNQRTAAVRTPQDSVSTFSLDTDRTSFQLALNWARAGYDVEPDSVRSEEWVNAFDYRYKQPSRGDSFCHSHGCHAASPRQRNASGAHRIPGPGAAR